MSPLMSTWTSPTTLSIFMSAFTAVGSSKKLPSFTLSGTTVKFAESNVKTNFISESSVDISAFTEPSAVLP